MGFAPLTGQAYFGMDAFDFLRTVPGFATTLVEGFNAIFQPDVLERALGAPGEPGDPERLMHLTQRLLDVYEGFLDEAARVRGASLPDEFQEAQKAAGIFGSNVIEEVRTFVAECVKSMEALPELVDGRSEDDPPATLTLTLTLTLDDHVNQRFVDGMRSGVDSL
jgi:hypothetical protein